MSEPAIHVLSETRASVSRIAVLAIGKATPSAQRTVLRWIKDGCTIKGRVVHLDGVRVGRSFVSSEEAFARFVAACNERPALPERDRTPAQMRRDSERAMKRLAELAKAK